MKFIIDFIKTEPKTIHFWVNIFGLALGLGSNDIAGFIFGIMLNILSCQIAIMEGQAKRKDDLWCYVQLVSLIWEYKDHVPVTVDTINLIKEYEQDAANELSERWKR